MYRSKLFNNNPNLRIIHSIPDGNCFFHSILHAYGSDYVNSNGQTRQQKAIQFRHRLAEILPEQYNTLNNGITAEFGKTYYPYSLEGMIKELKLNICVDNKYQEIISNELNTDIYIIDTDNDKIYATNYDLNVLYKNRKSIVLLYSEMNHHYDILGCYDKSANITYTLFSANSEIPTTLYNHLIAKKYGLKCV